MARDSEKPVAGSPPTEASLSWSEGWAAFFARLAEVVPATRRESNRRAKRRALQAEPEGPAWHVNMHQTSLGHFERSEQSPGIQVPWNQILKLIANRKSELLANALTH